MIHISKYILIYFLLGFSSVGAYFGLDKIDSALQGRENVLAEILIQDYVIFLLSFLAIVAILYGIW